MSASSRDFRSRRILVVLADPETVAASLDCARAAALSPDDAIIAVHAAFSEASEAICDEDVDIEGLRSLITGARRKAAIASLGLRGLAGRNARGL